MSTDPRDVVPTVILAVIVLSAYDSSMPDLLVRNVSQKTLEALRERARRNDRSVQSELLELIERGVEEASGAALVAWASTVRTPGASVDLAAVVRTIREGRDER
jgi:plasmid stability protein